MQKGNINVTSQDIFPIIKKFLYSDHEIFLRELISNAVDATQKLKTLSSVGDYKGELGDTTIQVNIDKEAKTITISDKGIGMTADEIDKYINQLAFSGAEDFLDKYKDDANAIIGHFGLGFYSSFMVSERVDIITKSRTENSQAIKWSCDGSPEFTIEDVEKEERGTDIILHIDEESKDFLEDAKINELLTKYCKFLPVEIAFGKKRDHKDGKEVETEELNVINNTNPAWTKKPADLKDEDYKNFYKELYPMVFEDPLFHIHLNVDYPFNLTGILYFPKIKKNIEIQKNKIQLFSNQVFVTDSVENIVPEFLTFLHGVIDSPDIPLNVSRSYLQSDKNVKKISGHITKKVADKLNEIFKKDRKAFEEKWDDLKLFVQYGMLTDEKFYEKATKFFLFKTVDNKYYTIEEYNELIKIEQTNKDKKVVHIYTSDVEKQYSFIEAAKDKAYSVLILDGHLDSHFVNHLEAKLTDVSFVRVDAEVASKLITKEDSQESKISQDEKDELTPIFQSQFNDGAHYMVTYEDLSETDSPMIITQSEFMRRMKDMQEVGGGGQMSFYGDMPDSYNLVVNTNHPLIANVIEDKDNTIGEKIDKADEKISPIEAEVAELEKAKEGKKEDEISQEDKDKLEDANKRLSATKAEKETILKAYAKDNKIVKQLVDLALLANNMLKGKELTNFVKRSVELIK